MGAVKYWRPRRKETPFQLGFGISLDVTGCVELMRVFEQIGTTAQAKVLRPALTRAWRPVRVAVQREIRRQGLVKTGRMLRTIKARALPRKRGSIGRSILTGTRAELGIPDDSKHYYPAALEYGESHGARRTQPKAFMRKAFDATKDEAYEIYKRTVRQGIERLVEQTRKKMGL